MAFGILYFPDFFPTSLASFYTQIKFRIKNTLIQRQTLCLDITFFLFYVEPCEQIVCYTAVFSVVAQRSSPQTAAESRTTFLFLCTCGLTNKPVMPVWNLTIRELQGARKRTRISVFDKSINRRWSWTALCLQATRRLICRKVCFKRLTKYQVKKRLLPGLVVCVFFWTCICIIFSKKLQLLMKSRLLRG